MSTRTRADGRAALDVRPIMVRLGELDRADGSGRFAFGSTAALASFTGPIEVRLREEKVEGSTLEITHRPLDGIAATPSRALVTALETVLPPLLALEQHPRSLSQLVVQSLAPIPIAAPYPPGPARSTWPAEPIDLDDAASSSSSAPHAGLPATHLAAALNAASLALLSANSIAMHGVATAVALVYAGDADGGGTGALLLDPDEAEERAASSRHIFAWAFGARFASPRAGAVGAGGGDKDAGEGHGQGELVWSESAGRFSRREWEEACAASKVAAWGVLRRIRAELETAH
ncbi:hypothetical protein Q5752_005169 [Cryptotrichosporon argae]